MKRRALWLLVLAGCSGGGSTPPVGTPCTGLALFTYALDRSTIEIGESTQGTLIARGCGGTAISLAALTWVTSDALVATVDEHGRITGISPGNALITAKLGDATAYANVGVSPPRTGGSSGGFAVRLFSPTLGAVVDDSLRVLASVQPQGLKLSRVTGFIGAREFKLSAIYVGMSQQELWEARLRVDDIAAGNYKLVVRAFDLGGASAADSVIFERRLEDKGGTGTGASGQKLVAPGPVKRP